MLPISRAVSALAILCLSTGFVRRRAPTTAPPPAAARAPAVRLYALDCGHLDIPDMKLFGDVPEYAGARAAHRALLPGAAPARPPPLGHGAQRRDRAVERRRAQRARHPGERDGDARAQLDALGISPDAVTYVGLSHLHDPITPATRTRSRPRRGW